MSVSQFHIYLRWVNKCLAKCLKSVLIVNALVDTFNQEMALVEAFSVIAKTDGLFAAIVHAGRQWRSPDLQGG